MIEYALSNLRPNKQFIIRGNTIEWLDVVEPPTEAEIQAEVSRLQAEYEANEYQRQRAPEYPSLAEFADAYYWAQKGDNTLMDAYVAKCDAVKSTYPKPE